MAVILNESAIKAFGWEQPLEKKLFTYGYDPGVILQYQVVGVVKDFHFASLKETLGL